MVRKGVAVSYKVTPLPHVEQKMVFLKGKGKGEIHPRTDHEGPEGE